MVAAPTKSPCPCPVVSPATPLRPTPKTAILSIVTASCLISYFWIFPSSRLAITHPATFLKTGMRTSPKLFTISAIFSSPPSEHPVNQQSYYCARAYCYSGSFVSPAVQLVKPIFYPHHSFCSGIESFLHVLHFGED